MLLRIWNICCSLKLAIYLASAITLLLMGGSLLIPYHSQIFGSMDQLTTADWLANFAAPNLDKTWWFYLAAFLTLAFGINTLCCFCDWLGQFRSRWRKTGEYLLHLGVVLVLIAYFWGSYAGWRHNSMQFPVGEVTPLPNWPGHFLRVDSFQPLMSTTGPPKDMINHVSLLRGDQRLTSGKVQINQPLFHQGVVITPVSFGRQPIGFTAILPGINSARLASGETLFLTDGSRLKVHRFLADIIRSQTGEISYRNDRLGNPAFELEYHAKNGESWQGWYFVRNQIPPQARKLGLQLRLLNPIYDNYSVLTVNYDPGSTLAAVGSSLMSVGVLLALFSFYRKRKLKDRPEI